jgi:hypothetical protein
VPGSSTGGSNEGLSGGDCGWIVSGGAISGWLAKFSLLPRVNIGRFRTFLPPFAPGGERRS